jgi:hypothetical protein
LASHYVQTGRFDEAGRQFDRLLELDPEFAPAYVSKAALAAEMGRFDEQIRWLQRAIEMDPGRLAIYSDLVWAYADIDDLEPLEDIKHRMAEINDQHIFLALTDVVANLHGDNYEGALESARWIYDRMNRPPFVLRILGYIQTMKRDYPAARETLEAAEPRLFDREQWRAAIEANPDDACLVGWLLARTGDATMGAELVAASLDYLENELPRYVEHADRRVIEACYLAIGDQDKALAAIETRAAHGHNAQWWFMRKQPLYEPLWGDPRFEAVLQKIQDDLVIQRANLARTETAAYIP